jgi:hypothetical protein
MILMAEVEKVTLPIKEELEDQATWDLKLKTSGNKKI